MSIPYDPWVQVTTKHGFHADEVISALQKSIRRAQTEAAVRFAYEMYQTSSELEDMLWKRLNVISVEDIGFGALEAPILIDTLDRMRQKFPAGSVDRPLFFVHAIRYLCSRPKTRSSDLLKNIVELEFDRGMLPDIPDIALDMHTEQGRRMGRGPEFFYETASQVFPVYTGEEPDYRSQLMELMKTEQD